MFDLNQIKRISVVAAAAMLFGALAPTVTQARTAHAVPPGVIEVCTVDGIKQISLAEVESTSAQGSKGQGHHSSEVGGHGEGCPFCHLQILSISLEPISQNLSVVDREYFPPLFYKAPKPLFAWAHSRSRAPPSQS